MIPFYPQESEEPPIPAWKAALLQKKRSSSIDSEKRKYPKEHFMKIEYFLLNIATLFSGK